MIYVTVTEEGAVNDDETEVILQLHAGGIINKWFFDQFNPAIFMDNPDPVQVFGSLLINYWCFYIFQEEPLEMIHIAVANCVLGIPIINDF